MTKSRILVGVCIAFVGGVLLASVYRLPVVVSGGMVASLLLIALVWPRAWVMALVATGFCCGMLRYQASVAPNQFEPHFGTVEDREAVVVAEPDVRSDRVLLTVRPIGFSQDILITTTLASYARYGDYLAIHGVLKQPQRFEDFDYARYLERYRVYAVMKYPRLLVLKSHQGNRVIENLLVIKSWFIRRANHLLPAPQSTLLLGILIGARKALPQDVTDNFTAAGVSHVIAVSGYNISIIITALEPVTRYVGRKWGTVFALLIIFGFVIVSGATSSVIRAAIMGSLLLCSYTIGRLYSVGPSLWLTAAGMVVFNPRIAYWDVGFQLSFVATVGIVYGLPVIKHATTRWPGMWGLKQMLVTTLVAIVATAPLVAWQFGNFSVIAPVANLLVVPLVPLTMLGGFLLLLPIVGQGFAWLTNYLLRYLLWAVAWCAHLPYASVRWRMGGWWVVVWYAAMAGLYVLIRRVRAAIPPI